jgi:Holliday junction resolvase RusA-like endonuclease
MISFVVEGAAVPQARPRFTRFGHAYDTKKCKDYKQLVAIRAKEAMAGREPLSDACIVMIDVRVSPPESWSKVKRAAAIHSGWVTAKTGDLDNLCKSVTDSLIGICYEDDCRVAGLIATKRYAEESEVIVEIIEPSRNYAPIWAAGGLRRAFHFLE